MLKSWIETRHSKMKRIGSMLNKTSAEVWLLKRHTRGVVILNKSPVSAMALFAWMQWPSQENKNMPKAQFSKPTCRRRSFLNQSLMPIVVIECCRNLYPLHQRDSGIAGACRRYIPHLRPRCHGDRSRAGVRVHVHARWTNLIHLF